MKNRLLEFINHPDSRVVELLLTYGANIYECNEKGQSVFHRLGENRNQTLAVATATKLLQMRVVVMSFLNAEDYRSRTALQLACNKRNWSLAK
ncbi:unnamed protein product [Gongylonema pulchrum]|uniref:Uncharacterized protein n=1 Tax=Gongylonema pulchrum TaxID=637853 RepID=A0A3P6QTK9_9BILA|nr:unnamed protein product [Gongylonema pulchrum]